MNETDKTYCEDCLAEIRIGDDYCKECGLKIESSQAAESQKENEQHVKANASSNPINNDSVAPPPIVQPQKKSRRNLFLTVGAVVLVLCTCSSICIAATGLGLFDLSKSWNVEKPKAENVIDKFMTDMADKNIDRAYDLFSTRAKQNIPKDKLNKEFYGNNYLVYKGYQSLTIKNMQLSKLMNLDKTQPSGTVAHVEGEISYSGGIKGSFNAVLEKEGGAWRIFDIRVVAPPDKFKDSSV